MTIDHAATELFEADRDRLASLAYRLLGSAADAEDAVQDAFLRWQSADRSGIDVPQAWLAKVVTNLCLDRLRSAVARRERVAGSWLPEPLLDGDPLLGPAETAEQRESVSLAVLVLLERLAPVERAVYVLREAFGYSHAEIADMLDISESASQQHTHRARRHVASARRGGAVDPAAARKIVTAFLAAAVSGRTEQLVDLLTQDASGITDGGLTGKILVYPNPKRMIIALRGAFKATATKRRILGGPISFHADIVNGSPAAIAVRENGEVLGALVLEADGDRISHITSAGYPSRVARLGELWRRREHSEPVLTTW